MFHESQNFITDFMRVC